jgi:hypothetical protein
VRGEGHDRGHGSGAKTDEDATDHRNSLFVRPVLPGTSTYNRGYHSRGASFVNVAAPPTLWLNLSMEV